MEVSQVTRKLVFKLQASYSDNQLANNVALLAEGVVVRDTSHKFLTPFLVLENWSHCKPVTQMIKRGKQCSSLA